MSDAPAIRLTDVQFAYGKGPRVLNIPTLEVVAKEKVFLFGPSGSGKTTLLGVLGGYTGEVEVLGRDVAKMSGSQRDAFRGSHLGYIFQLFNLIPYLSVLENITIPCRLSAERRARLNGLSLEQAAEQTAKRLGIGELLHKPVTNLSVGQQQRVAAARSLIGTPELIIADEPTSSLDYDHREKFLELLFESCQAAGSTLLFVSHDRSLMHLFDRQLSLPDINKAGS